MRITQGRSRSAGGARSCRNGKASRRAAGRRPPPHRVRGVLAVSGGPRWAAITRDATSSIALIVACAAGLAAARSPRRRPFRSRSTPSQTQATSSRFQKVCGAQLRQEVEATGCSAPRRRRRTNLLFRSSVVADSSDRRPTRDQPDGRPAGKLGKLSRRPSSAIGVGERRRGLRAGRLPGARNLAAAPRPKGARRPTLVPPWEGQVHPHGKAERPVAARLRLADHDPAARSVNGKAVGARPTPPPTSPTAAAVVGQLGVKDRGGNRRSRRLRRRRNQGPNPLLDPPRLSARMADVPETVERPAHARAQAPASAATGW